MKNGQESEVEKVVMSTLEEYIYITIRRIRMETNPKKKECTHAQVTITKKTNTYVLAKNKIKNIFVHVISSDIL